MKLHFLKYQGTGNDFIILDNRQEIYSHLNAAQIAFLCHRRFGVGADGMMVIAKHEVHDFEMIYYNADGRESSMCGNGGRCIVKAVSDLGSLKKAYKFLAIDGLHEAEVENSGAVSLKMNDVENIEKGENYFILNTGSPHYVQPAQDVEHLDVFERGREIRYSAAFKEHGINVNFVEALEKPQSFFVRTYERGVEDETFSCGTGVTAAALVNNYTEGENNIKVKTKGGLLEVSYLKKGSQFHNIWLKGPAEKVFAGIIEI